MRGPTVHGTDTKDVPLRVRLLGNIEVEYEGQQVTSFESDKARALMVYLLLHSRALRREVLAGLLWGDRPESRARGNLSRVLTNLRRLMPGYLLSDRHTVQFDTTQPYWLDVKHFIEHARQIDGNDKESMETLQATIALYRGDFLEGFSLQDCPEFEEWMIVERERLRRLALRVLDRLIELHFRRGEHEQALNYARRSLHLEPWREATHRHVMLLLARTGQSTAALRHYECCRTVLAEELDLPPSNETTRLYHRIRTAETRPRRHLDPQPNALIGREQEITEIRQRLADPGCRLLSLVGPGGVGKSRLALEAAQSCASAFLEGVAFVPLAGVTSAELLPIAIALALDLNFHRHRSTQSQLLEHLKDKEILLILDNFEQLIDGAPFLIEILRSAPEVQILATSRERLRLRWEWVFELRGLPSRPTTDDQRLPASPRYAKDKSLTVPASSVPDAVKLFLQRATQASRTFEHTAENLRCAIRICTLLDGLPLGIELAAALTPHVPCNEIADQLQADLTFLKSPLRDVPPRHRSLRALFEHSWRLLNPKEQRVLAQLAIFQGPFDAHAAHEITQADPPTLRALTEKSLVGQTPDHRYQLHERTRQFAAEKREALGLSVAQLAARHGRYYLVLVRSEDSRRDQSTAHEEENVLAAALDNVRAAWMWASDHGEARLITDVAPALARYYEQRGWFEEGYNVFARVVAGLRAAAPPDAPDMRLALNVTLTFESIFAGHLSQQEMAGALAQEALDVLQDVAAPQARARTLVNLGLTHLNRHRYRRAVERCEQGLALYRQSEDIRGIAEALNALGNIYYMGGDYEQAGKAYRESATHFKQLGDLRSYARVANNLGNIAFSEGEYAEAQTWYEESLAIKQRLDDRWGAAISRHNLGEIALIQKRYAEAKAYFTHSVAEARALYHRAITAASLNRLADVARAEGDVAAARHYLHQGLAVSQGTDNLDALAEGHWRLARLARELGDITQARQHIRRAAAPRLLPPARLRLLLEAAELLAEEGDVTRALTLAHFVARQPEKLQATQDLAAALITVWREQLPSKVAAEAEARGRALDFEGAMEQIGDFRPSHPPSRS
ncbi:MAG: ATP-binding protein, partial [Anaerolineae bacterium]